MYDPAMTSSIKTSSPNSAWPDLAGRIEGKQHRLPIRVYFEDTDFSGVVYHTNYLKWCERGRSDFIRLLGIHHSELIAGQGRGDSQSGGGETGGGEPAAFVVRHMDVDFLRPAQIDDVVEVVTECAEIGGATLTLQQQVFRGDTLLLKLMVKIVLVSQSGKPQRIGKMLRDAFERNSL